MEPPEVAGRARGSRDLAKVRAPAPFARLLVVWRGEVLGRPTIQNLFSKKSKYAREHFLKISSHATVGGYMRRESEGGSGESWSCW